MERYKAHTQPRLLVRGLSKTFGSNTALRDVSLTVRPQEVHGLVGQNGSGKSTLIKLLSGHHSPDSGGAIEVDGVRLSLPVRPVDLRRCRLSVVHQDLGLVDSCSVVENVRVGNFGVRRLMRMIRWDVEREETRRVLAALGQDIDPDAKVAGLSSAERASVAIARALQDHEPGRGLVVFDESGRALPRDTLGCFQRLIRGVVAQGGSVLLVSHQLEEVLSVADRVTVLRDGAVAAEGLPTRHLSEHDLLGLMLGYQVQRSTRARSSDKAVTSRPAAMAAGVRGRLVQDISLSVAGGEIIGVTGLAGSGFEELPYLISGARRAARGTLTIDGTTIDLTTASPGELIAAGVALVPERRLEHGVSPRLTVLENVTIPRVRVRGSRGWTGNRWQREEADRVVRELGVQPHDTTHLVGHLSGGNQQKVLLGKWLVGAPRLLVLHEPTQGVDAAARLDLIAAIIACANAGSAVIVAGIDPKELADACDRVMVVRDGRISEEIRRDLTSERIVAAVYGPLAPASGGRR